MGWGEPRGPSVTEIAAARMAQVIADWNAHRTTLHEERLVEELRRYEEHHGSVCPNPTIITNANGRRL